MKNSPYIRYVKFPFLIDLTTRLTILRMQGRGNQKNVFTPSLVSRKRVFKSETITECNIGAGGVTPYLEWLWKGNR